MGMDNANSKRTKLKWKTSYSKMDILEAEKRLGFKTLEENAVPVNRMLDGQNKVLGEDILDGIKRKVYENILDHLDAEGYPSEVTASFKEANVNDLVCTTIVPRISSFRRNTNRKSLQLQREQEIVAVGTEPEIGGVGEFI